MRIDIGQIEVKPKTSEKCVVIHDVYIIDSSGSMGSYHNSDTKAHYAIKGVTENLIASQQDTVTDKLFTVCIFGTLDIKFARETSKELVEEKEIISLWNGGGTNLYDAIGATITFLTYKVKPNEKVSIKIFTDGEENNSETYSASMIDNLIKAKTAEGWNIAFIGTERDVELVQRNLSIHKSNTISYDGTGKGFKKSMQATLDSMESYSIRAAKGEDVSLGFFKEIDK